MNQVAFILENTTIYWHSIVLALSVLTGICFFMACCCHLRISSIQSSATVLTALVLSLLISRLMYWYSRADSFKSFGQALTTPASGSYSLTGVFIGCAITVLLMGRLFRNLPKLMDCMSIAGCGAICLGRLSNFFTSADRGQIVTEMTYLPWAYPVVNAASGMLDYRLATFVFQSIVAGVLFAVLCVLFFRDRKKTHIPHGDISLLFLMVYSASQVLLDSTRYDSLYFRSNGFVSIVQVLCAVVLGVSLILISIRAVKALGLRRQMVTAWVILAGLFGLAGYMEYYVQRHGKLAFFSYAVMEHCLVGILVLGIWLWRLTLQKRSTDEAPAKADKKIAKKPALPKLLIKAPAEKPSKKAGKEKNVSVVSEMISEVPSEVVVKEEPEAAAEAVPEKSFSEVKEKPVREEVAEKTAEEFKEEPAEELVTMASDPEDSGDTDEIISDRFFEDLFSDLSTDFLEDIL